MNNKIYFPKAKLFYHTVSETGLPKLFEKILAMKKIKIILSLFLVWCMIGCVNTQKHNKEVFKITDARSLGKFLYSIDNFGVLFLPVDEKAIQDFQETYFANPKIKLVELGIFRSPDFDWKERQNELIIHFFIAPNTDIAKKMQKSSQLGTCYRNGKFIISPHPSRDITYINKFNSLIADVDGNLLTPPFEIGEDKIHPLQVDGKGLLQVISYKRLKNK